MPPKNLSKVSNIYGVLSLSNLMTLMTYLSCVYLFQFTGIIYSHKNLKIRFDQLMAMLEDNDYKLASCDLCGK